MLAGLSVQAQKKDENIGTEVINVVKPYTPTISDAFKVKETPVLEDAETQTKQQVNYTIFSVPVASTFTPAKGRAAGVDRSPREVLYKNYLRLGIGNYANALAELYVVEEVGASGFVSGMLRHGSTQGGIDGLYLDDKFMDTALDLAYGDNFDNFSYRIDGGYQHQHYNWYGIYGDYWGDDQEFYDGLDVGHTYHNAYVSGVVSARESFFKEAQFKYNRFWDSFDSAENRFTFDPSFAFEISDTQIRAKLLVDHVSGEFARGYFFNEPIAYGFTNIGIKPSFAIHRNDWTINLGMGAFYSMDSENSDGNFFIFPNVTASLKVVGDLMVFYAGAEGALEQNSYRDFTNRNPFVSPTLAILPTNTEYDIYAGLKGKLAGAVGYNVRAFYKSQKDKALFKLNEFPPAVNMNYRGYDLANSFGIAYDDVKTIGFFGELNADFSKDISASIHARVQEYKTDEEAEAWNLPEIEAGANITARVAPKWFVGADAFYVGERKEYYDFSAINGLDETLTLDSYFDLNAKVMYQHNERLSGFLNFNNLLGKNYEKWLHYPVQGFQVMAGASYKFDF